MYTKKCKQILAAWILKYTNRKLGTCYLYTACGAVPISQYQQSGQYSILSLSRRISNLSNSKHQLTFNNSKYVKEKWALGAIWLNRQDSVRIYIPSKLFSSFHTKLVLVTQNYQFYNMYIISNLSIYLFISISVCLSISLFVSPSVCQSFYLSLSIDIYNFKRKTKARIEKSINLQPIT